MPKLYKKLIDIIALLCLAAIFLFTFSYLKSWWTEEIGEKRQEQNIWKEKRTGTWCTIKSNSLDGVPIYDEAGGSVPIGSLPEGKLCELPAFLNAELPERFLSSTFLTALYSVPIIPNRRR